MAFCGKCGTNIVDGTAFCPECGAKTGAAPYEAQTAPPPVQPSAPPTKFCKHCAATIPLDAVICTACGRQVETLAGAQNNGGNQPPPIIINNSNTNTNNGYAGRQKNKWVAVLLCFFLGVIGAHRFYEGKIASGILYLFTVGLGGVGVIIDLIILLLKPNPYYVR